ncbi:alpha/beta hydrolase [Nocardia sp. NPDC005366]|uniref:alpha/beta fold hydrolase n=1 Tax=Nocardia sp. NPDC005366 TaxID=3156878 RepID=UPI0033BB551F
MTSDTSKSLVPATRTAAAKRAAGARAVRKPDSRPKPTKALHIGSGDPVLLLHGFLLSPHSWEQTAARLAGQCEVFAPALTGHWGAAAADSSTMNVHILADRVERQLDELGWRTCHIAGNSLGGWVGVELARRGRARTLTLVAPAGGWNSPSLTQIRVGIKFLSLVPMVGIGKLIGDFAAANPVLQRFASLLLGKSATSVPRGAAAAAITAALNCDAMIPMILGGMRIPALADLSTLTTPVRLLLAEHDRIIPNRVYARRFLRELPDSADRILVNGVGHVPMLEAPDRIATLIAEHIYASRTRLRAV